MIGFSTLGRGGLGFRVLGAGLSLELGTQSFVFRSARMSLKVGFNDNMQKSGH